MKNLATFKLENILASDGITEMKIWEKNGIYTVTTNNKTPDFNLDNYGCEDKEDLLYLAKRSLKRVKENSVNEVINFINNL
jgi:hypothetical protein